MGSEDKTVHNRLLLVSLVILGYVAIYIALRLDRMVVVQAPPPVQWSPENSLQTQSAPALSDDLSVEPLLEAIAQSQKFLSRKTAGEVKFGPDTYSGGELAAALRRFEEIVKEHGLGPQLAQKVTDEFLFYESRAPKMLFTGYFEAELRGSRTRTGKFTYPLYMLPKDIISVDLRGFPVLANLQGLPDSLVGRLTESGTIGPYYSRHEIDHNQALAGKNLELVWTDDELDAFFLHIQGSGKVSLPDGSVMRVNYAGKNGHPYRAIGKLLLDQNKLQQSDVSMQRIKEYLRAHPHEQRAVFDYNPSYVFFREVSEGPIGSIGVPLTPNRSIATDYRLFPRGALAFIESEKPIFDAANKIIRWQKFGRFVLNQDTGGAITGPGRVDLFTGSGSESENIAGHLRAPGRLFFLALPKQ